MDVSTIVLLALVMGIGVAAYLKDHSLPMEGLAAAGRLLGNVWIDLALGFLIAGLLDVLLSPAEITAWLGSGSSARGIIVGWVVGLILPGGPYLLFPVAANLFKAGAAPGALIALITAKTLLSPIRILTYEAPLLGWQLTIARCVPALCVPPIMGLLGQWIFDALEKK
ncbi:hypothetical protein W02_23970 [Nitrospira sp. KM1]|nr:hypothetical protein W02_23970 [Nitrospira sp. KM1]